MLTLTLTLIETMLLCEMDPQLKLPINVTKGSMQCHTYFPKIKSLAILNIRTQVKFNLPLLMKVLTDFLPINKMSTAFISLIFGLQAQPTMAAKMYS